MSDEATTIVIMGATGDLTKRKLLPALFNLRYKGRLPHGLNIVGFARSAYSDDQFRELTWEGARQFGELSVRKDEWESFARDLFYVSGSVDSLEQLAGLNRRLEELEAGRERSNRLFYLSIAPQLYATAVENLGASGLVGEAGGWRRVVIEKPFGRDLASAQSLNKAVHRVFDEGQVFRIDHYLGKETVQNLLVLRFANVVFEPLWNHNYVDSVQITVAEKVSVGDRAGYYDRSGVVRDMVQNHLLQLLTVVAMEPPSAVGAESLRDKKVEVLSSIRRWSPEEAAKDVVLGQYGGYLKENGVTEESTTPTFTALRLYVDNERWQGVPFYLRTGKALAQKVSEILIRFKHPDNLMFALGPCEDLDSNLLAVCLQPDEGVHLRLEAKVPDQGMCMQSVDMEFHYASAFKGQAIPEAYERLLQDALEGDGRLFIRNDHIEEAWRIVDPLLKQGTFPLHVYEPGSWGPDAAEALLSQDGQAWLQACGGHGEDLLEWATV